MHFLISRKEQLLTSLLATYIVYYLGASLAAAWGFTTDDAFISWFYAQQFAKGNGLIWHQNFPRVEGYSNFLWVMLAALVIKLQWPLALSMKWFSVISLGGSLFFLYKLGRLFFSPLLAMLAVFLFSHYIGVVWWTVSGMESAFFSSLVLLAIWQCVVAVGYSSIPASSTPRWSTRSWIIANLALLGLCLTRFDGIVWFGLISCFLWCHFKEKRQQNFDFKTIRSWPLISLLCFGLPYFCYIAWRLFYFGHLLPNSYLCKAFVPGQTGIVDLDYLQVIIVLIVCALPYWLLAKRDCRHVLLWLPSVIYAVLLLQADPILAHRLRLFLTPFALFSLLPVLGIVEFLKYIKFSQWDLKLVTSCLIIIVTFLFIPGNNLNLLHTYASDYQGRNENRLAIANLLNSEAARGATVLLGDCGIIPFYSRSDIRFIDSQCLNNAPMTQKPYYGDVKSYAYAMQTQIKPDWVIVTKPLFEAHGDFLMEQLDKNHFLDDYKLVAHFQSGAMLSSKHGSHKVIDYVYRVYQRSQ